MTRERVSQKLNCLKSLSQCPPLHDKTPTPMFKQFAGRLLHMPPKSNTSSAPTATGTTLSPLPPSYISSLSLSLSLFFFLSQKIKRVNYLWGGEWV